MCRKCEKTRQFSKLKKYYQDEDLNAAQLARSHAQAKVNDQEELFEDALDRGVLEQEIESAFSPDEYGEEKGLDSLDFAEVDRLLGAPRVHISKKELVEEVAEDGADSIEEFEDALEEYGYGDGNWPELLRQSVSNDRVSISGDLTIQEILEEKTPKQVETESGSTETSSLSSQKSRLIDIAENSNGDIPDLITDIKREDIEPIEGLKKIEKLVRSGQVDNITLSDIEGALSQLESDESDHSDPDKAGESNQSKTPQHAKKKESKNKSQPEIVIDAIRSVETPTEDEIVEHCVKIGGLSPEKARKILDKLYQSGKIYRKDNYEYRLS